MVLSSFSLCPSSFHLNVYYTVVCKYKPPVGFYYTGILSVIKVTSADNGRQTK